MKKYVFILYFFVSLWPNMVFASGLEQTFKVEIGPFDAALAKLSYQKTNDKYAFLSSIQTMGFFDVLYSFKADYQTEGKINGAGLTATFYEQKTASSAHQRAKKLLFDQNGVLYQRESTKDKDKRLVDVTIPEVQIDAYDMQTVLMMLIKNFEKTGKCDLKKTVFNGKKIYQINIQDKNEETIEGEKVQKCAAFIHQEHLEKGDLLWQVSSERYILMYLAKAPKTGLPFLKKLEIDSTPLGKLTASLQTLKETEN